MNIRNVQTYGILWWCLLIVLGWHGATQAQSDTRQKPHVAIVGSGPLVPQGNGQAIPISYKNTTEVDVEILHLTSPHDFLNRYYLNDNVYPSTLDRLSYSFNSVFADRYTLPTGSSEEIHSAKLPIPAQLASGWYIVTLKAAGMFDDIQAKHMLLTELGVQARIQKNEAYFSVNRLKDGSSVANAKVSLYRKHELIRQGTTDTAGNVHFSVMVEENDIVFVEHEGNGHTPEVALLPLKETPLDLSGYDLGGRMYQDSEAYIYSNRDLVRPGDALPINILLRNQDGYSIDRDTLTLTVKNPHQDEIVKETLPISDSGLFEKVLTTAKDWPTGRYTVGVKIDPSSTRSLNEFQFQLEEFVPERMDLNVSPTAQFVYTGRSNQIALTGKYLFGSPAAGNQFTTDISYQPIRHFSGPYKEFVVGQDFYLPSRFKSLAKKRMSNEGIASVDIPTPSASRIKSPIKTTVFFALQESGGAAVQRSTTFTSWKDQNLPALKPLSKTFAYKSDATFDVALLSPNGQKLETGRVKLTLYYDQGRAYWMYEEGIGWTRKKQDQWRKDQQIVVDLNADTARIALPVSWGDYKLEATDLSTGAQTLHYFYAGWERGYHQSPAKPEHLQLSLNKTAYTAGEQAKVTFDAPIDGELLITLESDKVLWSRKVAIEQGQRNITLPLSKDLNRHDLYVTASLFGQQQQAPKRYLGITPLRLDRTERQIALSATLPDSIEPLQTITIPIKASGVKTDQTSWVTVSMVDKGIINLSRFKPQNPHTFLFSQRRYSGDIIDLYSRQYDPRPNPFAQSRFGSDNNANNTNRNDDLVESKTIQLMSKPTQLVDGEAVVELTLPDYNGEAQIIVTAFNDQQVGQLIQDQVIRMPLVAELSVPRFLVPGDHASIAIDLHNVSGNKKHLTVNLQTDSDIELPKNMAQRISLDDGENWRHTQPIRVSETAPDTVVTFTLSVQGEDIDLKRSWRVPVKYIEPWATRVTNQILPPGQAMTVSASAWHGLNMQPSKAGNLLVSHGPIFNITEFATGLHAYPYGCAEQTTSKAWPFALNHAQLTKFQHNALQKNVQLSTSQAYLSAAIKRLKTMQKTSGGFALWGSYGAEKPWLTVYVTDLLTHINRNYPELVPSAMLEDAQYRVLRYARGDFVDGLANSHAESTAAKSYAAYLASRLGKLSFSDLEALHLKTHPSKLSLLHLAAAYANTGASLPSAQLLKQYQQQQRTKHYFYDYGSDIRDAALATLALDSIAQVKDLHQEAQKLRTTLLEQLPDQVADIDWLSTQERAALLRSAVASAKLNQQHVAVTIDNQANTQQGLVSHPLTPGLLIKNTGDSNLYVQQLAKGYVELDEQLANHTNPFNTIKMKHFVRRWYTLDGQPLDDNITLKVGDRLLVVLDVQSKERIPDTLIVDRIPAGFVLENPALLQDLNISELLPPNVNLADIEHQEYRNDRYVAAAELTKEKQQFAYLLRAEVPGVYGNPPTFLESMYRPQKHVLYRQYPSTLTIVR
ncbi:MG2 domain-containing protein [Pseudoalteromonas sp. SMS1]|uniref:alpha-2-macroglobulin family protein n=1 Tax=Pseudoalteromonas sp. SMS1 TaxID=2908894 RepID=UPI001F3B60BE|nr:MG2 domain-containing protein [Pseudoalteromonas sp. SMS1]MCF2856741.1 MG2 domain-containing protein [Pseudoalteromonas sp. SMS1]